MVYFSKGDEKKFVDFLTKEYQEYSLNRPSPYPLCCPRSRIAWRVRCLIFTDFRITLVDNTIDLVYIIQLMKESVYLN